MSFFATFAVLLVLASPTLIVLNSFCEELLSSYRGRACVRCDGCDSRQQSPSVCESIFPSASYSQPSGSADRKKRGKLKKNLDTIF